MVKIRILLLIGVFILIINTNPINKKQAEKKEVLMYQMSTSVGLNEKVNGVESRVFYRRMGFSLKKNSFIREQDIKDIKAKQLNVLIISTVIHPMSIPDDLSMDACELKERCFNVEFHNIERKFWKNGLLPEEILASGAWDAL